MTNLWPDLWVAVACSLVILLIVAWVAVRGWNR